MTEIITIATVLIKQAFRVHLGRCLNNSYYLYNMMKQVSKCRSQVWFFFVNKYYNPQSTNNIGWYSLNYVCY